MISVPFDALVQQKLTLEQLAESAPSSVVIVDPSGRIVMANANALKMFGYAQDELRGEFVEILVPERYRGRHTGYRQEYARHPRVRPMGTGQELWARRKDGTEFPVDIQLSPFRGEGNLVVTVIWDMTARKRAEEELRKSEEKYRRIVDTMTEGVALLNVDDRISYVNGQMATILGEDSHAVLGRDPLGFLDETTAAQAQQELEKVKTGERVRIEFRITQKTGGEVWVSASGSPLFNDAGQYDGALAVFTDITHARNLEEQLLQAQKMESIGRLAGGIAHDFNNLLTVINGYSDLLVDKLGPSDPVGEKVVLIRNAGRHAASLTQQLLAFSRRQVVQPRVFDLNQIIRDVNKMLERVVHENIMVRLALSTEPVLVLADPGQLSQVIINLSVNARDAMPNGGRLLIETGHTDLDRQAVQQYPGLSPGRFVELTVTDIGIGMDEATRSRIFEPFFTAGKGGKGTGLGLATVYGIVNQAGGAIEVRSELGVGTEFKILLPAANETPTTETVHVAPRALWGNETVLLVEDQSVLRGFVREILEKHGYTVLEAADGVEAVRQAQDYSGTIHLLLTDMVMPGMRGDRLVEKLKPLRPEMKVMYMSGYTDTAGTQDTLIDSETAFLQKPFPPDVLAAEVRKLLGSVQVSGTILLIDDEPAIRRLLRLHLESAGYKVLEAQNGKAALRQLADRPVDLVLTDLHMPEMEGIELLRFLHQTNPDQKIVAMSGAHETGPLEATKYLGACAILEKPFDRDRFLQVVHDALTGQAS